MKINLNDLDVLKVYRDYTVKNFKTNMKIFCVRVNFSYDIKPYEKISRSYGGENLDSKLIKKIELRVKDYKNIFFLGLIYYLKNQDVTLETNDYRFVENNKNLEWKIFKNYDYLEKTISPLRNN